MGMDNRKGAFWLQLHDHYKQNGYVPEDNTSGEITPFDPAQFSLCYDRQPLSAEELIAGLGAGALTLGGTDPLLHNTDMVFAANITPQGGWYAVRVKAMFLRTNGGTLSEPPTQGDVQYVRVPAKEDALNGNPDKSRGVILDSGTTDTYLPLALRAPFEEAWTQALGDTADGVSSKYHNNAREMTHDQVKSLPTILVVLHGHEQSITDQNVNAIGMTTSHESMFVEQEEPREGIEPVRKSDVIIAIPPEHYMEESHKEPGKFTARIYFTERYGAQAILGSNVLMGHEVLFDNRNGRIGIAESHCDYSRYVEERDEVRRQQQQHEQQQSGEEAVAVEDNAQQQQQTKEKETSDGSSGSEEGREEPGMGADLAASGWARR